MSTTFWTNTIWFILLGAVSAVELIIAVSRARHRRTTFALFLTFSGLAFSIEAIVCCFLKGYSYHPLLIPQSPLDDDIAGNLFSQSSIAATAILLAVLKRNGAWYWGASVMYGLVEQLFLARGLYEHHWYATWITVLSLPVLFWLARQMYEHSEHIKPWLRYVYILLGLFTLHTPPIIWAFRLSGIQSFSSPVFAEPRLNYTLMVLLNLAIVSNVTALVYLSRAKWWWHLTAVSALFALSYLANRTGLLIVRDGWFASFTAADILGMYLGVYVQDRLYPPAETAPVG